MHTARLQPNITSAVPALAGAAVVTVATSLPAICPFRLWSGQACPLCGMTRALHSVVTGEVSVAWSYHPMVFAVIAQAALFGLVWAVAGAKPQLGRLGRTIAVGNVIALVVVWLVRWRLDLLGFVLE